MGLRLGLWAGLSCLSRPEEYLRSGGFWQALGIGAAGGAVAGAVGWLVPTLLPASGLWGSVGIGALSGALSSGAGQVTANVLNPCVEWYHDLGWAMATGGVTGGIAGGVGYGVKQWLTPQSPRGTAPVAQPIERHHLLPRQFREYFGAAGLNFDAPEFVVELPRDVHRLKPNGLHTGPENWSALWDRFIRANPTPDPVKILEHLNWMMGRFGLR